MRAEMKRRIWVVVLGLTIVMTGCDFGVGSESDLPIAPVENTNNSVLLMNKPVIQALNIPACMLDEGGCDKPADPPVVSNPPIINPNVENVGELCPTLSIDNGGTNESLLAYANAGELTLVYENGDVVHVALPNFEAAAGSKIWTKVQAKGDYILVKRDWRKPGLKHIRGVVYTMLDRDGNLVWHVHQKGVSGDARVLDNASAVGQTTYYPLQGDHYRRTMTIDPSGAVNEFDEDYRFLGAAVRVEGDNPHYEMPVRLGDDQDRQTGWLNLADGTFNAFWFGDDTNDVKLFGNHLYRFTASCGYFLAVSTAGGTFDFQGLEFYFDIYQSRIVATTSTGWVLFQHNETGEYTRLRLHSDGETLSVAGQPKVLNLTAPEGFETACQAQPEMDDRGGVLFTFRDDFKALVFRQDRNSDEWKAIGAPMTNVIPAKVETHGASVVVNTSLTKCESNCGGAFEETIDGTLPIDGASVQVIHPRSGNTFILNPVGIGSDPTNFLPKFDKTGQCFSTSKWSKGSFSLEVVDAVLGTTTQVEIPGVPTWLP
jgi:hypothetical protein